MCWPEQISPWGEGGEAGSSPPGALVQDQQSSPGASTDGGVLGGRAEADLKQQIAGVCAVIPAAYRPINGFILQG